MDINTFRGLSTLVLMLLFVGLCIRVYSPSQRKYFDKAANIPFADEEKINNE